MSAPDSPWKLDGTYAALRLSAGPSAVRTHIDLLTPRRGLHALRFDSVTIPGEVLSFDLDDLPGEPQALEAYVRGQDLIAIYAETEERPLRVQAYWRMSESDAAVFSLDFQLSVQTSHWDSQPEMRTGSLLPAAEASRLADAAEGRFVPLSLAEEQELQPSGGAGCVLFRLKNSAWSYAEMIHPDEFQRALVMPHADTGHTRLVTELFQGHLEKGVILRGRLRGLFLPADRDRDLLLAAYHQFVAAPPPLTV